MILAKLLLDWVATCLKALICKIRFKLIDRTPLWSVSACSPASFSIAPYLELDASDVVHRLGRLSLSPLAG